LLACLSGAFSGMGALSPRQAHLGGACKVGCNMEVRASLSQCTEYRPPLL
jgi:hypothetical protein